MPNNELCAAAEELFALVALTPAMARNTISSDEEATSKTFSTDMEVVKRK
jgi:hypothetical protein